MKLLIATLLLVALLGGLDARKLPRALRRTFPRYSVPQHGSSQAATYKTFWHESKIDKLGYTTDDTFMMRYLLNDSYWAGEKSPIFLYAGNEGDITGFANNTGIMYEFGAEMNALIVFAEHRYYGESKIYNNRNCDYLSSEHALADFAEFVTWLKSGGYPGAENSPVIVFGGSYGGMLAAWMRFKYPFVVDGAWAASAPVAWFGDLTDCNAYDAKVTEDFKAANENCPNNILRSWDVMDSYAQTASGLAKLSEIFNLCSPLKDQSDYEDLIGEINDAWGSVAMVNYPYPTEFLQPLPAWPVKVICSKLSESNLTDAQLVEQIAKAVTVYYNYDGRYSCFNISEGDIGLDDNLWGFQACTEMIMPMCSRKGESMFPESAWDLKAYSEYCENTFQRSPRPSWAVTHYGARQVIWSSNIIFSNGRLDPWGPGGVFFNQGNPSVYPFFIDDAAHHLDLRASNPADPDGVKAARAAEKWIVWNWIEDKTRAPGKPGRAQTLHRMI